MNPDDFPRPMGALRPLLPGDIGFMNLGVGVAFGQTPKPESTLEEAQRLVHGPRQADYGHPFDDYTRTGRIWEAILGLEPGRIPPHIACLMMAAVKMSRQVNVPKRDNMVDMAGYAECGEMCVREGEARRAKMMAQADTR